MQRRQAIAFFIGALLLFPFAAAAQPSLPVIGFLSSRSAASDVPMLNAFEQGLKQAGYAAGKNVQIESRWADGQYGRLPSLAADLVRRKVDVIVTAGGEVSALAAKSATADVPIIFTVGIDPVSIGLVSSLNRPGGNLTGVTSLLYELASKQLGLVRELLAKPGLIAMLVNPYDNTWVSSQIAEAQNAAAAIGQSLLILKASNDNELDAAFTTMDQQRPAALVACASPFFVTRAERLIEFSNSRALPAIYFRRELAEVGGLMSYSSSTAELYGLMGLYAAKILGGTKPADLPVLQPTKFEFVINLKTAKTLGLDIPPTLLARADEVIE